MLQDLMQLQALLCSSELLPVMHVAQYTLTQLKECGQEVVGHLSLQLLTWPHVGKLRDVSVCVGVCVGVCACVCVCVCILVPLAVVPGRFQQHNIIILYPQELYFLLNTV